MYDNLDSQINEIDSIQIIKGEGAGFLIRLAAFIIDLIANIIIFIIIVLFTTMLYNIFYVKNANDVLTLDIVIMMGIFLVTWLYECIFLSSKYMATPGKMVCGIKVKDMNGNRITFFRATLRYIFKLGFIVLNGIPLISFFSIINVISPFLILLTEKKQAIHDLIAKTVVVYDYKVRF